MFENEYSLNKINELAVKYRSASPFEKKNIQYQVCDMLTKMYLDNPRRKDEFNNDDFLNVIADKIYGLDNKKGISILDKFQEGENFVAYMNTAIKRSFSNQRKRSNFEHPASDDENDVKGYSDIEIKAELTDEAKSVLIKILPLMAEFGKHLTKKQNNSDRQLYTQLFFTEHVTEFCKIFYEEDKSSAVREELMNKETLIFKSISLEFLDYIMEELCRCIREVSDSEYKQNKFFGIKQNPENRISPEFKANVYKSFLTAEKNKSVTEQAIHYQREAYKNLIRKICL